MSEFRRLMIAAAAGLLALSLTACQSRGGGSEERDGGRAVLETSSSKLPGGRDIQETLKIGVSIYRFDDNFMTLYRKELKKYLMEQYGAEAEILDAEGSAKTQREQIDKFLEKGCDAVILNLIQLTEAPEIVDEFEEAGIPLVLINRRPDDEEIDRWKREDLDAVYVGTDDRQCGAIQGEIISELPDKGDLNGDDTVSYVMIKGRADDPATKYRSEYSVEALESAGIETEELLAADGEWREDLGKTIMKGALDEFDDSVEVVFCNNDAMANGARVAIMDAGRTVGEDIYLVGVDALEETVGYVRDGTMTGTVLNDHAGQAHRAADAAVQMAKGAKTEKEYLVDYIKIVLKDSE